MCRVELSVGFLCVGLATGIIKTTTPEPPSPILRRFQMECIEETRVDVNLVTKVKHGNWGIPLETIQLVKDWALCVFMKTGLMTKQGVYKIDLALSKIPEKERDSIEKMIDSCLSKKAIPAPDIAYYFAKCFQRARGPHSVTIL